MRITTFASGSSGNCVLVSMGETHFLLDAGVSFRRIRENLALSGLTPGDLTAVLITHEHADHIAGLATLVKRCGAPVYAPPAVADRLRRTVPGLEEKNLGELPVGEDVTLGMAAVRAFPTPHDAAGSVGYRICGDGVFALATDMGHVTEEIRAGLAGADAVLIEANHDEDMLRYGPYPYALKRRILSDRGHLSNAACAGLAAFLASTGTKYIILGHLSRQNNTPELAGRTVRAALAETEAETGRGTQLYVAPAAERLTLELEKDTICLP